MAPGVVLVTGASSGIGEATVRLLLGRGHVVYAGTRRLHALREVEALGARVVDVDVADDASMTAAVERVLDEAGRIDVLVNNAGYGAYGAVEEMALDGARRQVEVNLFGLARMTQLVLPGMRLRRSGRVINISSVGGKIYGPFGAWYHATKFAVEGFSDALRLEVAPFGVRVVIIEPGEIRTGWGGIAADSLRATSGAGPYAAGALSVASLLERSLGAGTGTPPEAVAAAVVRAMEARHPKARYVVGRGAGTLTLARRILPDRILDRVMRRIFQV